MWASHSVHHSIEEMVFSAAFRLSWTPLLSGVFLFYLPIIWIGFDPKYVFGFVSAGLLYQFFVHTELVPRIPGLEWIINTPSAHRVHHASNPEYIDKNFGGVLLGFDRLFSTFAPYDREPTFGVAGDTRHLGPISANVAPWRELVTRVRRERTWTGKLRVMLKPRR